MSRKKQKKRIVVNQIEQKIHDLLTTMNLPFKSNVPLDKFNVDFLVAEKYIVECYGDYWHCNPQKYGATYYNRVKRKTAAEIWERDEERKKRFEELGYTFVYLWEHDIRNNFKTVRAILKKYILRRMNNERINE